MNRFVLFLQRVFDPDRFSEVWASLTRNPRRTLLTAFGVFWGMFMLVVMLGAGQGLQNGIFGGIKEIPSNMVICWSGRTSIPYHGFRKGRNWDIKISDLEAVRARVPQLTAVSPIVFGRDVPIADGSRSSSYMIKGVGGEYPLAYPIHLDQGRLINDMDVAQCRKVVVLGKKIVDEVFRGRSPLGQYVQVGSISCQVVGISSQNTDAISFGSSDNENIIMPYSLVQRLYNMGESVSMVMLRASDDVPVSVLEDSVGSIIRSAHEIAPEDKQAMGFMNVDRILQTFRMLGLGISILIWIVGLGTLLSGAVGVSNIVMITVKERTNEIGVRRAIGAHPSAIVSQIMLESMVITTLAGTLGLICGVAVLDAVEGMSLGSEEFSLKLTDAMISFRTGVGAIVVIIAVGVLAGILPATRAMKIKAIDAIREE